MSMVMAVEDQRNAHLITVEHFVSCILEGRPPPPDGREGARTVAACRAVADAIRTARPARPEPF
jgi:predicted dehydrogenase